MPTSPSTRLALIGPNGATDLLSSGDDQVRAIITRLEAVAVGYLTPSTYASRPAAAAANANFLHAATDSGVIGYSTGSSWIDINPKDAAAATASLRTLGPGAQQAAPGSTAAGTIARRVLVPDLAGVSTYTFTGLDGDSDRQYRLGLSGVFAISAVDRAISIRPAPSGASGSTANYFDSVYRQDWWDGSMQTLEGEYRGDGFGFLLAFGNSWGTYGANHVTADALIEARRKTGTPRTHKASWSSSPDAVTERQLMGQAGGNWENNANNITSLVVHFGGGTFTGDIWLERVFA